MNQKTENEKNKNAVHAYLNKKRYIEFLEMCESKRLGKSRVLRDLILKDLREYKKSKK